MTGVRVPRITGLPWQILESMAMRSFIGFLRSSFYFVSRVRDSAALKTLTAG